MTSTNSHPDGITSQVLPVIERQVSAEIAATAAPTTALLDGTARQRRDLRILARRLNGIAAKYGVTLEEAISKANQASRPVAVTLHLDDVIVSVAVETTDEATATTEQDTVPAVVPAATADPVAVATAAPAPAPAFGETTRTGRKAHRIAAHAAANLGQVA
jgi:hypothetical protein